jgi:hypothetical protein
MANEATIIELHGVVPGEPVNLTCANAATIEKGTLLKIADPCTAAASDGAAQAFIGIAAAEKVANDGSTTISVYTRGIFGLVTTNASVAAGERVCLGGANTIVQVTADTENLYGCVGISLGTDGAGAARVPVLIGSGL